jgi:outer membrane protein OmpA-like peptidoglycan-associated protein
MPYRFVLLFLLVTLGARVSFGQKEGDTLIKVYFGSNKYQLGVTEKNKLDSFFSQHPRLLVSMVTGHTDTVGSVGSNLLLSQRRSASLADYLSRNKRLTSDCVISHFGESSPASLTNNALNRRVELSIIRQAPDTGITIKTNDSTRIKKIVLDQLYFKPDLPVLESYSLDYLRKISLILKNYPGARFEIRGHVNCPLNIRAGSDYMNAMNKLSADRAKAVYEILIDNGIPAEKMTFRGMGNTQMVNPYARTEEEARKNMRVEIIISPAD